MNVKVRDLVGEVCMTQADGEKVHAAYREAFDAGSTVVLDFAGTRVFVSAFFNAAVAQLLEDFGLAEVRQRLQVVNLPDAGSAPLRRSVETAERYYRDPGYRAALDKVLMAQAEAP